MTTPKYYILDTNILLNDPMSFLNFQENIVVLMSNVLDELDTFKKGTNMINISARRASNMIEKILDDGVENTEYELNTLYPYETKYMTYNDFNILFILIDKQDTKFNNLKVDDKIVHFADTLKDKHNICVVTEDNNVRNICKIKNIKAEKYKAMSTEVDKEEYKNTTCISKNEFDMLFIDENDVKKLSNSGIIYKEGDIDTKYLTYIDKEEEDLKITPLRNYYGNNNDVFGVKSLNDEQNYAFNVLMNKNIDLVGLYGLAGTGKTLLSLAAALELVVERKEFKKIIISRTTTSLDNKDIGFLPGTEEEKMLPWLYAFQDNIDFLLNLDNQTESQKKITKSYITDKISFKSLSYFRGRSIHDSILIIDEAQNLSQLEMKAILTRIHTTSRVFVLGNLDQIDTPYITEYNSGLSKMTDVFKSCPYSSIINLKCTERGRLAKYANDFFN